MLKGSIALRLTLVLSAIAVLAFSTTGLLLHRSLVQSMAYVSHAELRQKIDNVKRFISAADATHRLDALREHLDHVLVEQPALRIWLEGADGLPLYGGGPPGVVKRFDARGHVALRRPDGVPLEAMEETVVPTAAMPLSRILVAFEPRVRDRVVPDYRHAVIAVCFGAALLSAAAGVVATRRSLSRVKHVSTEAALIAHGAQTMRLPVVHVAQELAGVVGAFNGTLDRLQEAHRQTEAFIDDAAHELRTPLATLISGDQVILSKPRSAAELRETLASNLEELEHLRALVNDMLFLARADHGAIAQTAELVDLGAEADKALEFFEPLIEDAGLRARREGTASAMCDRALMQQALGNLLSNAIKYGAPGQYVSVSIEALPGKARVSVFNVGVPIPADVATRMFDRFYRADEARSQCSAHHGLGLAIVQAIAQMHGGATFVETDATGNRVGFEIPGRTAERGRG
jgi:two-component system heavy metal sensor histidine kinase CusS